MKTLNEIRSIWAEPANYCPAWSNRAKVAASFIPSDAVVCDIGCGAPQHLRHHLPKGCEYLPCDMKVWHDGVEECDLSAGRLPVVHLTRCTIISILGVLEYLPDATAALAALSAYRKPIILSYHPADLRTKTYEAWVGSMTVGNVISTFAACGYSDVRVMYLGEEQFLFDAHPNA